MKAVVPVFLLGLSSYAPLIAQEQRPEEAFQAIHLEALGPGGLGSVNYERGITSMEGGDLCGRIGIGATRVFDFQRDVNPDLAIPFGLSFIKGKRWRWEAGAGPVLASVVTPNLEDLKPERGYRFHAWLSVGIRFHPFPDGWVFRATYTPLIEFGNLRHWGGLSIGHTL